MRYWSVSELFGLSCATIEAGPTSFLARRVWQRLDAEEINIQEAISLLGLSGGDEDCPLPSKAAITLKKRKINIG